MLQTCHQPRETLAIFAGILTMKLITHFREVQSIPKTIDQLMYYIYLRKF